MKKNINIIGIDQSLSCTGITIVKNVNSLEEKKIYTLIKTKANTDSGDRIYNIIDSITNILKSNEIDYIALEGLNLGAVKGNTARDLAGIYWAIIVLSKRLNIPYMVFSPKGVKKRALKGNAKKIECYNELPESEKIAMKRTGAMKSTGLMDLSDSYWVYKCLLDELVKDGKVDS